MFTINVIHHPLANYPVPRYLYTTALTKSKKICRISSLTFLSLLIALQHRGLFLLPSFLFTFTPLHTSIERAYLPCANAYPGSLTICGDFRGYHPSRGNARTNSRGSVLATELESTDLSLTNDGRPIYIGLQGAYTMLHLTFASRDVLSY